jgi:hypothetical protein
VLLAYSTAKRIVKGLYETDSDHFVPREQVTARQERGQSLTMLLLAHHHILDFSLEMKEICGTKSCL